MGLGAKGDAGDDDDAAVPVLVTDDRLSHPQRPLGHHGRAARPLLGRGRFARRGRPADALALHRGADVNDRRLLVSMYEDVGDGGDDGVSDDGAAAALMLHCGTPRDVDLFLATTGTYAR